MPESIRLLYEGLHEVVKLAEGAKSRNRLLYEGLEYTPFQIILLEVEDGDEGFLDRTTAAVEKITAAGQAGIQELTELQTALQQAGLDNSVDAVSKAIVQLKKSIPEGGFLGKLKSLGAAGMGALFGKGDDPAEKIAEIVSDGVRYQEMMNNIVAGLLEDLEALKPDEIVASIEQDNDGEFTDERKTELLNQIKEKILGGTLNDLISSDDEPFISVREEIGFSEKSVKNLVKQSVKPSKWFAGLKSLSGALGFGLGGDLPFEKFGLKYNGLYDDIVLVNISSLQQLATATATDSDDEEVRDDLETGTEELAGLDGERGAAAAAEEEAEAGASAATGEEGTPDTGQSGQEQPTADVPEEEQVAYLKILQSVPGVREPEQGVNKLASLLAAGYSYLPDAGLRNLLSEKVLRYDDVVEKLADHLPEDEEEIPAAVKKLADEMKVELGGDYDIVGGPDEIAALRAEIQALRSLFRELPEDERASATDNIRGAFEEDGLTSDVIDDLLNPDVPLDDVIEDIPEESIGDVEDTIPDNIANPDGEETADEEEPPPSIGEFYEYEVRTGKNKGKKFGVRVSDINVDDDTVILQRPNKDGTKFTANVFAVKIGYLGKKLGSEEDALAVFASANESVAYSRKSRLAHVALARMRGYILNETNDFRYTSELSPSQVIQEFYSLGGTNGDIHQPQIRGTGSRWQLLAGLKNG